MITFIVTLLVIVAVAVFRRRKRTKSKQQHAFRMQNVSYEHGGRFVVSVNKKHGMVSQRHYADCVGEVVRLKREEKYAEVIALLLETVEATERESAIAGSDWGVAPWYYKQLAIIYRKQGRLNDEVAILKRYARQEKALGAGPKKLASRLKKAKALLRKEAKTDTIQQSKPSKKALSTANKTTRMNPISSITIS